MTAPRSATWRSSGLSALGLVAALAACTNSPPKSPALLPLDRSSPVVYDNDEAIDGYIDEYLMALASAGDIRLVAMTTSSAIAPFNKWVSAAGYEKLVRDREHAVDLARRSGMRHLPSPIRGTRGHLEAPPTGRIADTRPLGSEGSQLIAREAMKATPDRPLILVMGGPLTIAADAYLLEPAIADKLVVAWVGGRWDDMADYNGMTDPWAAYVALQKLRLVQFTAWLAPPSVPKTQLRALPETPLRDWMIAKDHPHMRMAKDLDVDTTAPIAIMREDWARQIKHVSFDSWITVEDRSVPSFRRDSNGRAIVITEASQNVATEEWWRAFRNKRALNQ
jgi:hypothetical protein